MVRPKAAGGGVKGLVHLPGQHVDKAEPARHNPLRGTARLGPRTMAVCLACTRRRPGEGGCSHMTGLATRGFIVLPSSGSGSRTTLTFTILAHSTPAAAPATMSQPRAVTLLNLQYRTAAIDSFVAGLSPWEFLYLRRSLQSDEAAPPRDFFAGFHSLPTEIICLVIDKMNLEDVLSSWAVSRAWKSAWERDAVSAYLCRKFFPGLLETTTNQRRQVGYADASLSVGVLFRETAAMYMRRWAMIPKQRSFIVWDSRWDSPVFRNKHPRPATEPETEIHDVFKRYLERRIPGNEIVSMVYGDSKVAWRCNSSRVLIDDLATRERQICPIVAAYTRGDYLVLIAVNLFYVIFSCHGARILDRSSNIRLVPQM